MLRKSAHIAFSPKGYVALFFILLTLIGLFTVRDYGAPFDELAEMHIIRANLQEYAIRLEGRDGQSPFARMGFPPMSAYLERDHGICAYYLLAPFLTQPAMVNIHQISVLWSALTWLWFMLGCFSLYGLMRCLNVSRVLSCFSVLLLYLHPRFFAEGHYNNKDVVLLSFILFSLWTGARFLLRPGIRRGLLFSLASAMATNTKIIGILPWGLVGLAAIVLLTTSRQWSRKMIAVALATVASFVCFYAALTPALWDDPIGFFRFVLENAARFSRPFGIVIFRGADFYDIAGATPLPWYYLPYYILVTTPLYTLMLAAIGQLSAARRWLRERGGALRQPRTLILMVCTLAWMLPLGYAILGRPLMYNGWRHFYFTYAGLVAMAGYGACALWQLIKARRRLRYALAACLSLLLLITGIGIVQNHPYQFAYYNPLVKRDARHTMELDTWNAGLSGAFTELYNQKHDEAPLLRIGCYFNDIAIGTYKLPASVEARLVITAGREEPYLYYNSTYAYIYWAKEPPEGYHTLFQVKSYGNTIGVMYERDDMSSAVFYEEAEVSP